MRTLLPALVILLTACSTWTAGRPAADAPSIASPFAHYHASFWTLTDLPGARIDDHAVLYVDRSLLILDVPDFMAGWAVRTSADNGLTFGNEAIGRYFPEAEPPPMIAHLRTALPGVTSVRQGDDSFALLNGDGDVVLAAVRSYGDGLENRKWGVAAYARDGDLVAYRPDPDLPWAQPHIYFIHGNVDGGSGCGGLLGRYAYDAPALSIDAISVLTGYCRPDSAKISGHIMSALAETATVEIEGDAARLNNEAGHTVMVLTSLSDW